MRRLYSSNLSDDEVFLDADQARHARKALRLKPGDSVQLFDGEGQVAEGTLALSDGTTVVRVARRWEEERPSPWVTIAVAMPKGARADVLVEKASELGADLLVPLATERSVAEVGEHKHDRLQRLAVASAKQSGRSHLMQVGEIAEFADVVADPPGGEGSGKLLKLMADTDGVGTVGPAQLLNALAGCKAVVVLIGPEGGWTDDERERALEAGFVPWRMGPYTLRVETAAMAAVALCRQNL